MQSEIIMNTENYLILSHFTSGFAEYLSTSEKIAKKLYEQRAIPLTSEELRDSDKSGIRTTDYMFTTLLIFLIRNQNDRTFHLFHEALKEFDPNWAYILELPAKEVELERTRLDDRRKISK